MNEAFENGLIVLLNKFISEELWDDYDSFSTVFVNLEPEVQKVTVVDAQNSSVAQGVAHHGVVQLLFIIYKNLSLYLITF